MTAKSNHNGNVSNEIRFAFVIGKNTGFLIYDRYVSGNVVEVSTLNMIPNASEGYRRSHQIQYFNYGGIPLSRQGIPPRRAWLTLG
jgi:hypothetical protein